MNLPGKVLRGMDRWILGDPEGPREEEKSEAEEWLEANAADAEGDERWIQERERSKKP